jgi:hypothetical protein
MMPPAWFWRKVRQLCEGWICVAERHRDGVWHLHVVVATKAEIRTGTDVETLSNYKLPYWLRRGKNLRNEALAAEWRLFTMPSRICRVWMQCRAIHKYAHRFQAGLVKRCRILAQMMEGQTLTKPL